MDEMEKYRGIPNKIAKELAYYEYRYFREDAPVPFCGLSIYPATVHDYERFMDATSCLTLNKNGTLEGIRMTNLEYLYSMMESKNGDEAAKWAFRFTSLIDVCFHIKSGYKCLKCGRVYEFGTPECAKMLQSVEGRVKDAAIADPSLLETQEGIEKLKGLAKPTCDDDGSDVVATIYTKKDEKGKMVLVLDGHEITSADFDRLRQIVLFQNLPDYRDESWVDPSLKKDREMKLELERKQNDVHASIEKKIVCLSISTNYKFGEIYDMPIRKFTMALSTVDDLINYQITKLAMMTGLVSMPKGKTLEHWIYKPDKDMYGDTYKSLSEAQSTASNVS